MIAFTFLRWELKIGQIIKSYKNGFLELNVNKNDKKEQNKSNH